MIDKILLMSGAPMQVNGIRFRQPTLGDIYRDPDVGKDAYDAHLFMISLDVEGFLSAAGLTDVYLGIEPAIREQIGILDLLTAHAGWRTLFLEALAFFTEGAVQYNESGRVVEIVTPDGTVHPLDSATYEVAREFIMRSACLEYKAKKTELKFYNERARLAWERLMKHKEEMRRQPRKTDPSFELWNVIGAVSSKHPSINMTNIWQLTVYQLYDQFARLRNQVSFDIYSARWAAWGKDTFDHALWFKQDQDNKV